MKFRLPKVRIVTGLLILIGFLVLASGSTTLVVGLWSAGANTFALLREESELFSALIRESLERRLRPAEKVVNQLAEQIESGQISIHDTEALTHAFHGAVAGTPFVNGLVLGFSDGPVLRALKSSAGILVGWEDRRDNPELREQLQAGISDEKAVWGSLFRPPDTDVTLINVRRRINISEDRYAFLLSAVPVTEFSRMISEIGTRMEGQVFVLYGDAHVLAHPELRDSSAYADRQPPLPTISEINDPVLAAFLKAKRDPQPREKRGFGRRFTEFTDIHLVKVGDGRAEEEYAAIFAPLDDFGAVPWQAGMYFPTAPHEDPFQRIQGAALWGIGILVFALLCTWQLARVLSRPWQRLSQASDALSELSLDEVEPLPKSVWREIDDASGAFNRMLSGLKWFETYVPKRLVRRLMADSGEGPDQIQSRDVTVLFTDIVGFTGRSEALSADATADFLNHHFALLHRLIDAESGTVDKFIGDSVMAFWGAPEHQHDHAVRACRTALAIRRAITDGADHDSLMGNYRMRIGIHSGMAVVGNIGAPDRMNYTIVGDTVNIANRLEQFGKEITDQQVQGSEPVTIIISEATMHRVGALIHGEHLGQQVLRGRRDTVDVYQL